MFSYLTKINNFEHFIKRIIVNVFLREKIQFGDVENRNIYVTGLSFSVKFMASSYTRNS